LKRERWLALVALIIIGLIVGLVLELNSSRSGSRHFHQSGIACQSIIALKIAEHESSANWGERLDTGLRWTSAVDLH
jgi:hypothetical protein